MDNIRLHEMPTKIKWKMQACFMLYLKFWEVTSVKSYKMQLPVFLFLFLHQFLFQQISFLQLSMISFNIIWKRFSFFVLNFSFLNDLPLPLPQPHPLINGQNLNVTKVFCEFSLKCLLKCFFQKFDKIVQIIFWMFQLQILWFSFQRIFQGQLFWHKHQ